MLSPLLTLPFNEKERSCQVTEICLTLFMDCIVYTPLSSFKISCYATADWSFLGVNKLHTSDDPAEVL